MAIDEANEKGGAAGYNLNVLLLDERHRHRGSVRSRPRCHQRHARWSPTPRWSQHVGPMSSTPGQGDVADPVSQGNLATITPTSTNPDITDPKFASLYRPGGKAIYFRTVTTDAYQGPNMANYFADTLKVKSVYGLDDSGAYGIGIADRVRGAGEEARHRGAGTRPARPEGRRLHPGADQDQSSSAPRRSITAAMRRPG